MASGKCHTVRIRRLAREGAPGDHADLQPPRTVGHLRGTSGSAVGGASRARAMRPGDPRGPAHRVGTSRAESPTDARRRRVRDLHEHGEPENAGAATPGPRILLLQRRRRRPRAGAARRRASAPARTCPDIEWIEVATAAAVSPRPDAGSARPARSSTARPTRSAAWGSRRQLKDEIYRCPPILVLTGRPQDAWLASWSQRRRRRRRTRSTRSAVTGPSPSCVAAARPSPR